MSGTWYGWPPLALWPQHIVDVTCLQSTGCMFCCCLLRLVFLRSCSLCALCVVSFHTCYFNTAWLTVGKQPIFSATDPKCILTPWLTNFATRFCWRPTQRSWLFTHLIAHWRTLIRFLLHCKLDEMVCWGPPTFPWGSEFSLKCFHSQESCGLTRADTNILG